MANHSRAVSPNIGPTSLPTQSLLSSNSEIPSVTCETRTPEVQLTLEYDLGDGVEISPVVESEQPAGEYSTSFYILSRC